MGERKNACFFFFFSEILHVFYIFFFRANDVKLLCSPKLIVSLTSISFYFILFHFIFLKKEKYDFLLLVCFKFSLENDFFLSIFQASATTEFKIGNPQSFYIGSKQLLEMEKKEIKKHIVVLSLKVIPAQIKWNITCGQMLIWRRIWKNVWKAHVPVKWNQLYYLMLHLAVYTGERAMKSGFLGIPHLCSTCKILETTTHLFLECSTSVKIWRYVKVLMWKNLRRKVTINFGTIVDPLKARSRIFVLLHRIALWSIWHLRNKRIFEDEIYSDVIIQATFNKFYELSQLSNQHGGTSLQCPLPTI